MEPGWQVMFYPAKLGMYPMWLGITQAIHCTCYRSAATYLDKVGASSWEISAALEKKMHIPTCTYFTGQLYLLGDSREWDTGGTNEFSSSFWSVCFQSFWINVPVPVTPPQGLAVNPCDTVLYCQSEGFILHSQHGHTWQGLCFVWHT